MRAPRVKVLELLFWFEVDSERWFAVGPQRSSVSRKGKKSSVAVAALPSALQKTSTIENPSNCGLNGWFNGLIETSHLHVIASI